MTRTERIARRLRLGVTFYPRFVPVLYMGKWPKDLQKREIEVTSGKVVRAMLSKVEPWKTRWANAGAGN